MLWWLTRAMRSQTTEGAGASGDGLAPPAAGGQGGEGGSGPPARPDWMPETFWRNGDPDYEGLGKAYTEIRTAFSGKEETLRAKVLAEMRAGVPEAPEKYELKINPAWLPSGFEAKSIAENDPLLTAAKPLLHKLGAKQEDFDALTEAFVRWQASTLPDPAKERVALGENAEARIAAVDAFLAKHLDEPGYNALADVAVTAAAVGAIEKLMMLAEPKQPGMGGPQGAAPPTISPQEAEALLLNPDYNHPQKGAGMREKFRAFVAAGGRVPGYQRPGMG